MSVKVKIKHLKPGTVFNAGPVAVRVLEHFADGKTLVITDECIADRPFNCQPFKPNRPEDWKANNWRTSTLRADLNCDFLNSFDEVGGPILSENIIPAEWDLTDSAGNNTYGSVTDKIGLLTEAMFRKYYVQGLLDLNYWWWLVTPDAGNAYGARYVDINGALYYTHAYYGVRGVRPALYVESEIEVELEFEMNHCGWIICPYNSEYDKDFDLTDGYCKQDKEHCELRDNPKKALKEILESEVERNA